MIVRIVCKLQAVFRMLIVVVRQQDVIMVMSVNDLIVNGNEIVLSGNVNGNDYMLGNVI